MPATEQTIAPQELARLCQEGEPIELIDVRTPAEFRAVHVAQARNVPLDALDMAAVAAHCGEKPLYVICHAGGRAATACEKLLAVCRGPVVNVEGGTAAWAAAGLPVVRGRRTIPLDGQVRIVLGSIVLIGALLALAVHPAFVWVCLLMGASLIYSGATGYCGMAIILAKMPWNQGAGATCSTPSAHAPAAPK